MQSGRRWFGSKLLLLSAVATVIALITPARASAATYYLDNQRGAHCTDGGPHTEAQPWCSLAPLNRLGKLAAGDRVLLARGSTWHEELRLTGTGTAAAPIVLSAYGSGAKPRILGRQRTRDLCIELTNPSQWEISELEVGRASVGILLHFTRVGNEGIAIHDVDAHDNKGIWSGFSREFPATKAKKDPFAARLNIDLSSGILFNLAQNLALRSDQYVLRGVRLSRINGTHNVDSVAFDAETSLPDGGDGHNAFQDVVLDELILTNDDGHAGKAYQAAGLGCSDSLRLLGMTQVTVMNSVLHGEAACHAATGTAAVILGRVSRVTFVNNIIESVPATDSPDETGIDFEWSESHVSLLGNFFADNAGPAVELLNIHPGDHTSEVRALDNTFVNNARVRQTGAASVWEDQQERDYATPTGLLRGNLYAELHGKFLAGASIGSIKTENNIAVLLKPHYAAKDFSAVQGNGGWVYLQELADGTWQKLPEFAPDLEGGAWETRAEQYVSAFRMKPGACTQPCMGGSVARAWVATRRGTVQIRGRLVTPEDSGGDTVGAAIQLVTKEGVRQIWPAEGQAPQIGTGDAGLATDVDNVHVEAGDQIRFEVHATRDGVAPQVSWTPAIGENEE